MRERIKAPHPVEMMVIRKRAAKDPVKMIRRACLMLRMVAIRKVLSPRMGTP